MKKTRFQKVEEFVTICQREGFFTSGDNRQYTFVCAFVGEVTSVSTVAFDRLVTMTYICSNIDKFSYIDIERALTKIFE